ncbi:hypothetical protein B0H11DRAFT_1932914 [Mycena galericulata]|nr:hypothetical protein B0H11DRAFT_1932914 [Mycena galericulata]
MPNDLIIIWELPQFLSMLGNKGSVSGAVPIRQRQLVSGTVSGAAPKLLFSGGPTPGVRPADTYCFRASPEMFQKQFPSGAQKPRFFWSERQERIVTKVTIITWMWFKLRSNSDITGGNCRHKPQLAVLRAKLGLIVAHNTNPLHGRDSRVSTGRGVGTRARRCRSRAVVPITAAEGAAAAKAEPGKGLLQGPWCCVDEHMIKKVFCHAAKWVHPDKGGTEQKSDEGYENARSTY